MSLIRLAVAGLALCAGASVASAQGGTPDQTPQGESRGKSRGGMQAKLFEGITLTDAQQQKISAIRVSYREDWIKIEGKPMPDQATRAKRKEAMAKQQAELRAVLTTEQQVIFDKNAAQLKSRRDKRTPAART